MVLAWLKRLERFNSEDDFLRSVILDPQHRTAHQSLYDDLEGWLKRRSFGKTETAATGKQDALWEIFFLRELRDHVNDLVSREEFQNLAKYLVLLREVRLLQAGLVASLSAPANIPSPFDRETADALESLIGHDDCTEPDLDIHIASQPRSVAEVRAALAACPYRMSAQEKIRLEEMLSYAQSSGSFEFGKLMELGPFYLSRKVNPLVEGSAGPAPARLEEDCVQLRTRVAHLLEHLLTRRNLVDCVSKEFFDGCRPVFKFVDENLTQLIEAVELLASELDSYAGPLVNLASRTGAKIVKGRLRAPLDLEAVCTRAEAATPEAFGLVVAQATALASLRTGDRVAAKRVADGIMDYAVRLSSNSNAEGKADPDEKVTLVRYGG